MLFAKYAWMRIPAELRLVHLDETQQFHIDNAEFLLLKHKMNQVCMYVCMNVFESITKISIMGIGSKIQQL